MTNFKKYKAVSPEDTINSIRNIVYGLGLFLKEIPAENDGLHSCRLIINNKKLIPLSIGTNGKGRSYEYSLASGYAEFMERIQNGVLYSHTSLNYAKKEFLNSLDTNSSFKQTILREQLEVDFIYDPEEEYWDIPSVVTEYEEEIRRLFHIETNKNVSDFLIQILPNEKIIMVPTYACNKDQKVMFPLSLALLATGTNGMCAGNTPSEAILQGLCEIFERYVASEIYFNHCTPPTIDMEQFRGTIAYTKMQKLKMTRDYDFCIKDCSLGIGLPVIGLIIVNRKNNTYNFKLGADFVPSIALERCLTEIYQSKTGFCGISLLTSNDPNEEDKKDNYSAYLKIIKNGTGQWPESIFEATYSYPFKGFNSNLGLSNKIDLEYGINLIKSLGVHLYIRDTSYLGIPAYYLIAPGLSEIYKDSSYFLNRIEEYSTDIISTILLNNCSFNKIMSWLTDITLTSLKQDNTINYNQLIPFYKSKELEDLDPYLFLCMVYYRQEEFEESFKYINLFLENKGEDHIYFYAAADYIRLKHIALKTDENTSAFLKNKYGEEIAIEICSDLKNPAEIFKYYNFIHHLNKDTIFNNNNSFFIEILKIHKRLSQIRKESGIDQQNLSNILKQPSLL